MNVPAGAVPGAGEGDRPVTVTVTPAADRLVPAAFSSWILTGMVAPLVLALAWSYSGWIL